VLNHWKLGKKKDESANIAKTDDDDEIFAFACSSDFQALATILKANETRNNAIIDSSASYHFCPDKSKCKGTFVRFCKGNLTVLRR
jgi:hypothetical protein